MDVFHHSFGYKNTGSPPSKRRSPGKRLTRPADAICTSRRRKNHAPARSAGVSPCLPRTLPLQPADTPIKGDRLPGGEAHTRHAQDSVSPAPAPLHGLTACRGEKTRSPARPAVDSRLSCCRRNPDGMRLRHGHQAEAHSGHGFQNGLVHLFQATAQNMNIGAQGVAVGRGIAVKFILKLAPAHDIGRGLHEPGKEHERHGRQVQVVAVACHGMGERIQLYARPAQLCRSKVCSGQAYGGKNPCFQLQKVQRAGDDVVRTAVQVPGQVFQRGIRGKQNDGARNIGDAQAGIEGDPVLIGQLRVEYDRLIRGCFQTVVYFIAVGGAVELLAHGLQVRKNILHGRHIRCADKQMEVKNGKLFFQAVQHRAALRANMGMS